MCVKLHTPFLDVEGNLSHYGLGATPAVPLTAIFIVVLLLTVSALGPKVFAHALVGGEHPANSGGPTPISSLEDVS